MAVLKTSEARGDQPLLRAVEVARVVAGEGTGLPSVDLARILISNLCFTHNSPSLWKLVGHAVASRFLCPLHVLALLTPSAAVIGDVEIGHGSSICWLAADGSKHSMTPEKVGEFKKFIEDMAVSSLRCVAFAYRAYEMDDVPNEDQRADWILPEDDLIMLGIVGIKDMITARMDTTVISVEWAKEAARGAGPCGHGRDRVMLL
ncbi:hypothetical protein GUJ93_ZPchr0014g46804 [Zizania palustris]|nr:hypothetical protein GUJ93_ZPchr0014g46804 [Zizania palustris]